MLVYMLLVDSLEVGDETLRKRLGVVVPSGGPSSILGSMIDTRERRHSGRLGTVKESDESQSSSDALTEVRILFVLLSHIATCADESLRLRKT
jgi:hypothetical protein